MLRVDPDKNCVVREKLACVVIVPKLNGAVKE